jgi:hypothetical protein
LFDRFVRKAGGFVRSGRAATRRHTIDIFNIDEDPFDEEPQHARWLLTTCIVAAAGTVLVGGTLLGLFNGHRGTSSALASLQSFALWPALTVPGKGNLSDVDDTPAALSPGKAHRGSVRPAGQRPGRRARRPVSRHQQRSACPIAPRRWSRGRSKWPRWRRARRPAT